MSHVRGPKIRCWEGNTSKQDYGTDPEANEYHWEVYHCKQRWINFLQGENPQLKNEALKLLTFTCLKKKKTHHILFSFSLASKVWPHHPSWNGYSFTVYYTTCSHGCFTETQYDETWCREPSTSFNHFSTILYRAIISTGINRLI